MRSGYRAPVVAVIRSRPPRRSVIVGGQPQAGGVGDYQAAVAQRLAAVAEDHLPAPGRPGRGRCRYRPGPAATIGRGRGRGAGR